MIQLGRDSWDGVVVLCAANRYEGIKVADQHMAEHLSRLVPVLYVDPPMSRLTPRRSSVAANQIGQPKLRLQRPNLARLTPIVQPCPSRRGLTGLTALLLRYHIRTAIGRLGGRVRAVISAWPQYPVFGSCCEPVSVYWAQDDFVGGASLLGLDPKLLEARERRVAGAAGVIVSANPQVADAWQHRNRTPVLIPFGADVDTFRAVDDVPPAEDVDLPAPIVGFVGQINDRTDLRLLEAVAERGRSLLLVGPRNPSYEPAAFDALCRRPNVQWVGSKPFDSLPRYLRVIDVGLVPYRDNAFNRASFPLKTLEYLAAGRAVVATDLPAIRWLATDLVTIAPDCQSFADHVDRYLDESRAASIVARRRSFAAEHSWDRRARDLLEVIAREELAAPVRRLVPT
jgi:glycosyltransferase involved in cell wall biosynthesis